MGATSVTGTGPGAVASVSTQQLNVQELNQIGIVRSGRGETSIPSSPSGYTGEVVFSEPLTGTENNYNIIITTIGGGAADILDFTESDGTLTGFLVTATYSCEFMYIVCKNIN